MVLESDSPCLYSIVVTKTAKDDLEHIYEYIIALDATAEYVVSRVGERIFDKISRLSTFPNGYVTYAGDSRYHVAHVGKEYVVLFLIDDDEMIVYISRIFYARRNIAKILEDGL